jgi:hypothetical protein
MDEARATATLARRRKLSVTGQEKGEERKRKERERKKEREKRHNEAK